MEGNREGVRRATATGHSDRSRAVDSRAVDSRAVDSRAILLLARTAMANYYGTRSSLDLQVQMHMSMFHLKSTS